MQMTQLIRKLGRNDIKLIGRDSFLIFMFAFAVIISLALRFGLPWMNDYLAENGVLPNETMSQSLADFYPILVAYGAIFTGAVMVGTIFGFMLLDEKDDNTIKAMLVTPVSLKQYAFYRVGLPVVMAFFIIILDLLIINQALPQGWQLLMIAAAGSLAAPMVSLFYVIFAENKVQGFAMSKFIGVGGMVVLGGWFIPEPFQFLLGLFPPFWVSKAYWMALEGNDLWGLVLIIGVVVMLASLAWLMRRFEKVAYR